MPNMVLTVSRILHKIAAVYDRAALIAMSSDLRDQYAKALIQFLQPGSKILYDYRIAVNRKNSFLVHVTMRQV